MCLSNSILASSVHFNDYVYTSVGVMGVWDFMILLALFRYTLLGKNKSL